MEMKNAPMYAEKNLIYIKWNLLNFVVNTKFFMIKPTIFSLGQALLLLRPKATIAHRCQLWIRVQVGWFRQVDIVIVEKAFHVSGPGIYFLVYKIS